MYLLVTYIPEDSLESVKTALFTAGAGKIGNYSSCSWQVKGKGQFKPEAGSSPFLGKINNLEKVDEYRLECVCRDKDIKSVAKALLKSHPYETPAYHLVNVSTLDDLK
ncbi:MAG: NGG1p interacting factor NIF3 [Spirochaetia bacterium]|jgi:hypothetical protein|nr:NGG1p interacting factor NIF3 [Spirochaetia bacterium]